MFESTKITRPRRRVNLIALPWILAALLCGGALLPPTARASFAKPKSLGQLARSADVILIGRARAVSPIPSLDGEFMAKAALLGGVLFSLRRRRVQPGAAAREALAAFLAISLAGLMVSTRVWYRHHAYIADVDVDRRVAGPDTNDNRIAIGFKGSFCCDETDLQPGERYLLFLRKDGPGYRSSWFHYGVCKETAEGFRSRSPLTANWSRDEDELVEEIQRVR